MITYRVEEVQEIEEGLRVTGHTEQPWHPNEEFAIVISREQSQKILDALFWMQIRKKEQAD